MQIGLFCLRVYCGNDSRGKPVPCALAWTDLERIACVPPKKWMLYLALGCCFEKYCFRAISTKKSIYSLTIRTGISKLCLTLSMVCP